MSRIIKVAVSGINAADNPGPGTGIARSLKESDLDVRMIGMAYDAQEPGIYMDWVIDKTYIMPWPSCPTEAFLERIAYIHELEGLDVIIPALDVELPVYMKIAPELAKMGIQVLMPSYETFMLRDKSKLTELAPQIGLKVPSTQTMTSFDDLYAAEAAFGYPMMIKGPFYEAAKARNRAEATKEFYELAAKWGYPLIAQEFIAGEEYNVIGLGDGHGHNLGLMATKKMTVTKLGKIWTNVSIRNEALFKAAQDFVSGSKWAGGFELELMQKYGTDDLYLIEINPRFPAWVYMASGCGINLPERLVKLLLNLPHDDHSHYDAGRILIRYTGEMIHDMTDFAQISTLGESK